MNVYENEIKTYKKLNRIAEKGGVVIFGSSFAKEIPVGELKQSFGLECDIFNRSLCDLRVSDAPGFLDDCVFSLEPDKVLLQLGETDLENGYMTIYGIISEYEKVISKIKSNNKHCEIVLVSVCNNKTDIHPEELNRQIEALAGKTGCKYADISPAFKNESPIISAFGMLRAFIKDKITFCDSMTMFNY